MLNIVLAKVLAEKIHLNKDVEKLGRVQWRATTEACETWHIRKGWKNWTDVVCRREDKVGI